MQTPFEYEFVKPSDARFAFEGRIDFEDENAPAFVYPCSFVRFRVRGHFAALACENRHSYFENTLGVLVDGEYRGKIVLHDGNTTQGESVSQFLLRLPAGSGVAKDATARSGREEIEGLAALSEREEIEELAALSGNEKVRMYDLGAFLDGGEHELTIFKRMDACHYVTLRGVIAEELLAAAKTYSAGKAGSLDVGEVPCEKADKPCGEKAQRDIVSKERRIEVYGDSISCGEVSEAIGRCGGDDPEGHNGIYSNSYYSYPWILARKLGARLHDIAQGGIALWDGTGYFDLPNAKGMLSTYDKIENNPSLGERKPWDFRKYIPHVVIIAIGQNDHYPVNFMVEDYDGEDAKGWRRDYRSFVETIRSKYPKATILLTTTILGHEPEWDQAIDEVWRELGDPKVYHFLYSKNGCGTTGHVRAPEAEQMAQELKDFLDGLGEEIWQD